jgi:Na+-transporting NADH:ubiquinone oxidoreductase subunit NqrB
MKNLGIPLLILTTLVLILVTIFASLDMSFSWVFYLTVLGQALLVFAVYKVLTDDYETDKTFKDWYEDRPQS